MPKKTLIRLIVLAVLVAASFYARAVQDRAAAPEGERSAAEQRSNGEESAFGENGDEAGAILTAYRARQSDVVLETAGRVQRTLSDDRDGTPHQRFLVRVDDAVTVLVAHNTALAPRVPLAVGDSVWMRGEYEWNEKGGVLHWTHHDPRRRRPGGWIRHGGEVYR